MSSVLSQWSREIFRCELDIQVCSLKERLKLEIGIRGSSAGMAGEAMGQHPRLTSHTRES